jgi:DNA-binding FadR family transcriptional regulator
MELSLAFHTRVAQATHNRAVEMVVGSFRGPILMSLQEAKMAAPEMGKVGTQEHGRLVAAIRRRDAAEATRIMREHLERTAHRVEH